MIKHGWKEGTFWNGSDLWLLNNLLQHSTSPILSTAKSEADLRSAQSWRLCAFQKGHCPYPSLGIVSSLCSIWQNWVLSINDTEDVSVQHNKYLFGTGITFWGFSGREWMGRTISTPTYTGAETGGQPYTEDAVQMIHELSYIKLQHVRQCLKCLWNFIFHHMW